MRTMEHIFRVVACLVAGAVLAALAYVSLSTANASPGWYYGIGLWLAAVTAFRVCVPTAGVPVTRIVAAYRKHRHDDKHRLCAIPAAVLRVSAVRRSPRATHCSARLT